MNLNPFKRKPAPTVVDLVNTSLTTLQWRQDDKLVAQARSILSQPAVGHMLAVLQLESPIKSMPLPPGATDIDIARAYGIEHGYQHAIAQLYRLARPAALVDEVPIEFKDDTFSEES